MSTHDYSFAKVAETSEIPVGKMKLVKSRNMEVLIANVNGTFYAIGNPCTHKSGRLSEGSLEGKIVTCPSHGSKFDITTGKSIQGPTGTFFNAKTPNATPVELRIDGKDIMLVQKSPWGI